MSINIVHQPLGYKSAVNQLTRLSVGRRHGWYLPAVGAFLLLWIGLTMSLPAMAQESKAADLAYARGILEYGNGNYIAALDHFRQAAELASDNADVQFYLGLTLSRLGESSEAIGALQKALQLDPSKRYIHHPLGLAYVQTGQYREALAQFDQALLFDPQKAASYFYRGYSHYQLKQYQAALPSFDRAIELDPTRAPSAQYYRGAALYNLGRDTQARTAFEAVVASQPTSTLGTKAQRYLETIQRRAHEQRLFQLQGVVSFQYDTNVTIGDGDLISREADGRMVFAFTGRLLPVRRAPWRLGVEYDLFQTLQFKLSDFDIQSHTARVFGRLKLDRVTLHAAANYTYTTLDNDRYSESITLQPRAAIQVTDRLLTVISTPYQRSNYFNQFIPPGQEDVRDRDGWLVGPGLTQYVTFKRRRGHLRLSYHFEASRNDGSDWDYDGHRVGLGLHTLLWWGIEADVEGAYRRRNYLHVNSFSADPLAVLTPADDDKRNDHRYTAAIQLARRLGRYLTLSAQYRYIYNGSNIGFFQYNRSIWTIALTGRY